MSTFVLREGGWVEIELLTFFGVSSHVVYAELIVVIQPHLFNAGRHGGGIGPRVCLSEAWIVWCSEVQQ